MPRGTTLGDVITMFREESGRANSTAQGKNELPAIRAKLRRIYRWLHGDFNWPHLVIRRDKTVNAGERYISLPADLDIERVRPEVEIKPAGDTQWYPLSFGINRKHFNFTDSDSDERSEYPLYWDIYENNQIELWPISNVNGHTLRFHGFSRAKTLTDDADTLDLDDDLVVLYALAQQLRRDGKPDADDYAQQARARYIKLRGQLTKRGDISMGRAPDRKSSGIPRVNLDYAERFE